MKHPVIAVLFVALGAVSAVRGAETGEAAADEQVLHAADLATDGPALLTFFRTRIRGAVDADTLDTLITRLASGTLTERRQAAAELIAIGPPAVPALRALARDPDAEAAAQRARSCLRALGEGSPALTSAAIRLLAARRPAGAVETLLTYLPHAEDESVLEETKAALSELATRDDRARPVLLRALEDKVPLRRATAAAILCQENRAVPRAALHRLLQDPSPSVRLRAALNLAHDWDADAVTVLVALLGELGPKPASEAEDFLMALVGEDGPKAALGPDEASRKRCRDAWTSWWQATARADLLEPFRKRTPTEATRRKANDLIAKLAHESFKVREEASKELRAMGQPAIPLLREVANSPDLEVRRRVRICLGSLVRDKATPLAPLASRLVALRKPAGAVEAILGYLPYAEEEDAIVEMQAALDALAFAGDRPAAALVRALEDASPRRRAAAASALAREADGALLVRVQKLLTDTDLDVRLKAALALANARHREAIPVLIELLEKLPADQAAAAEEYLTRLADNRVPQGLPTGDDTEARQKRRELWSGWWSAQGPQVVLIGTRVIALRERYHGYTLLVQPNNGQVVELDAAGKERWKITGLANPQYAEVLRREHVLIAEYSSRRVTERDRTGKILWEKAVPGWPMSAHRLRNGHTFIVCRDRLLEVDRSGRELLNVTRPNDVLTARKLPNGQIACVTAQRMYLRLDRSGKEIKSVPLGMVMFNANQILPNGHVLAPLGWQNKVVEYDANGKEVSSIAATQPMSAFRLPNGHVLTAMQVWPPRVIEVDASGKQVAQITSNVYTVFASRR